MVILGPNCLGVGNFRTGAIMTFGVVPPFRGNKRVAIVSQSGAMAASIYAAAEQIGLGIGHMVTTGNEACVDVTSCIDYYARCDDIDVVLAYIEQIRNGKAFIAAAREMRRRSKILAVYKVGRSVKGAEAARSHTAALTDNDRAYREAFASAGVVEADGIAELIDVAYLHGFAKGNARRGIGILTVSGAAGVAFADAFAETGHDLPTFGPDIQARLRKLVPAYGMVANPVDSTANVVNDASTMPDLLAIFDEAPETGITLVCASGNVMGQTWRAMQAQGNRLSKLTISVDPHFSNSRKIAEEAGFAYFNDMGRAARAISAYSTANGPSEPLPAAPSVAARGAAEKLAALRAAGRTILSEVEGKALLSEAGCAVVPDRVVRTADDAAATARILGFPVVLKLVSPDITHKTEIGGVKLGLDDEAAVREAFDEILTCARRHAPSAKVDGISVQPQILDAVELLVGATRDPLFGWMMTVGLGGVMTELMGDVVSRLAPVTPERARAMLYELKGFRLLDGFRGRPSADVEAASQCIAALSEFACATGDAAAEIEINPLLVRPQHKGAVSADAVILLAADMTDVPP